MTITIVPRGLQVRQLVRLTGWMVAVLLSCAAAVADEASLVIRGDIADPSGAVVLDAAALENLPVVSFQTGTIWTESQMTFSGPTLASVLALVGAGGGNLLLRAVNDYEVTLPISLVSADAPIIATLINGKPFSIKENGPLWVVFPYDRGPEFRTEMIYAVSVWQLTEISVLPE
jgi:hypothetical protein